MYKTTPLGSYKDICGRELNHNNEKYGKYQKINALRHYEFLEELDIYYKAKNLRIERTD